MLLVFEFFAYGTLLIAAAPFLISAYPSSLITTNICPYCLGQWEEGLALKANAQGAELSWYETRISFWRQLWRVLERSHVVLVLADARCPLYHLHPGLLSAVRAAGLPLVVVLNKVIPLTYFPGAFLASEASLSKYFARGLIPCVRNSFYRRTSRLLLP